MALVAGLVLAECQRYEGDSVSPVALRVANPRFSIQGKQLSPNVMLVVDKSFSMTEAVDGLGPSCATGGIYQPDSAYRCKWKDLLGAFADPDAFLDQLNDVARLGLTAYPTGSRCERGEIAVRVGERNAEAIKQELHGISPAGQTPTAETLAVVLQDPAMAASADGRRRYVLLLTDGGPNCNPSLSSRCDRCTTDPASCDAPDGCQPTFNGPSCLDPTVCLDEDATVSAIVRLHDEGINTLVIGFGQGTAIPFASRVLNRAALAGGQPRPGPTAYYQANSAEQLREVLEELRGLLQTCQFVLEAPVDTGLLAEASLVNVRTGEVQRLQQGVDWNFVPVPPGAVSKIELLGGRCPQVQNAPPDTFELQLRFVEPI